MTDGDGGDGGYGGDGGDGDGIVGGALVGGVLVGGGLIVGGNVMGGLSNLVPATPASLRKQLTEYKQMLEEGLVTAAEYDVLKARALGL